MSRQEFSKRTKLDAFRRANGRCEQCTAPLFPGKFEYDHVTEDTFGGEPALDNCKVLCLACHDTKTKSRSPIIAKSNRVRNRHIGIDRHTTRPLPCGRNSKWKKKMSGEVVAR